LWLVEPLQSDEIQPCRRGDASALKWLTQLIEHRDVDELEIGLVSGCPDEARNSGHPDVEFEDGILLVRNGGANSSRILIIGKRHPHLRDGLVQLLQRLLGELVSLSQVFFKVGRQDKPIPVDGLHTTEKRHPFPRELAKIDVVAAAATGTLRVAGGLLGRRLETVDGALEQADGLGPPNDVPAAIPSRQPWTA